MVGRYDNRFIIFINDSDAFNLIGECTGRCLHNQLIAYLQLAQFCKDRIAMSGKNTIVFFPGQHALDEVSYAFFNSSAPVPWMMGSFCFKAGIDRLPILSPSAGYTG